MFTKRSAKPAPSSLGGVTAVRGRREQETQARYLTYTEPIDSIGSA